MINSKTLSVTLLALLIIFGACAKQDSYSDEGNKKTPVLKSNVTLSEIVEKTNEKFPEYGAVYMPKEITAQILRDEFKIEPESIEEFCGEISYNKDSSDCFLIIKTKPNTTEQISNMLESYRNEQMALFSRENAYSSYQRLDTAQIYIKNNYVFYVCVGILNDDNKTENYFLTDIDIVIDVINSQFE